METDPHEWTALTQLSSLQMGELDRLGGAFVFSVFQAMKSFKSVQNFQETF